MTAVNMKEETSNNKACICREKISKCDKIPTNIICLINAAVSQWVLESACIYSSNFTGNIPVDPSLI